MQKHAEAIASKHQVTTLYICADPNLKTGFEIEQSVIAKVATTVVYYPANNRSFLTKLSAFKKGLDALKKQGSADFDLTHFNITWNAGWQALWMKWRFGLPYLISENYTGFDTSSRSDQPRGLRTFSRVITKNAAYVCPVTQNLATVMQKFGLPGNYHIVPNVVNTDLFKIHSPRIEKLRFLHISTLNDAHKNISGMLRCWKICSDALPHIHLKLGGDGPVETYMTLATELGIRSDSISFFGTKSPAEVAALMHESDCLVLFSNYENLPLVMIESLACGMAVISTNAGGVAEHIDEKLGYVIEKRDEHALVNALMKYSSESDKFKPENQRQYAIEHFSVPSIVAQFEVVYHKMLNSR